MSKLIFLNLKNNMEYKFNDIEKKWQEHWKNTNAYKVENDFTKPKCYVLDMFPYPSGAGLHVGHPLGYIASDIYSRYKRLKGFNVLHPMGYDAFGLPAEQYAIEHGIHPAESTANNIVNFRKQLDNIGFCYDWDRQVNTSEPQYYKWTQWLFLQLFNSYYNKEKNKAEDIAELIKSFEKEGNIQYPISNVLFSSEEWKSFDDKKQREILMNFRLAFCGIGEVNWCEALGTVLANDEVVNGVSERGGHPVEKKKLRQWYLRITEYADRLLEGLQTVDFSDAMKEMQSNWIGRSVGAEIEFPLSNSPHRGENGSPSNNIDLSKNDTKLIATPGKGYAKYKVDSAMSFENAKRMRKEPTETEAILWDALRNKQLDFKFRRQHPIENYIADFACLDVWLLIEIDGEYHNNPEQIEFDKLRNFELEKIGFTTLRFTNYAVINDLEKVLNIIKEKATILKESVATKTQGVTSSSPLGEAGVRVYTTRPDTIFGVDFMVVAPELDLVNEITTPDQKEEVEKYLTYVKSRSERERMAEKKITGCFTGAYALNPFNQKQIPIWISEYVLAGYGTGAIMAVPCGDERDFKFAKHFNIPITNIIGDAYNGEEANPTKDAPYTNSDFVNGLKYKEASAAVIEKLEEMGAGSRKVNYRMRDAAFSRQRYWGEPFPIVWIDDVAYDMGKEILPLELPHLDEIKPGENAQGPLANHPIWTKDWQKYFANSATKNPPLEGREAGGAGAIETSTMPGYAGSSWYFLRYMDPHNNNTFCDKKISDYWNQVDVYVGGTEHAVGHLLYSRMWTKFLYDKGFISFDEPFKKLLNQGMITGKSFFADTLLVCEVKNKDQRKTFTCSYNSVNKMSNKIIINDIEFEKLETEIGTERIEFAHKYIDGKNRITEDDLFKIYCFELSYLKSNANKLLESVLWEKELTEEGKRFIYCNLEIEKMSKSKYNTINPDELVEHYGADTFRMYEMFLGPVEMSKPWDTKGIEGVHRFLKKLWRLFYKEDANPSPLERGRGEVVWKDEKANDAELKVLHRTIKKIEEDTEKFSYNTAVSAFMICVNELTELKCHKKEILAPLLILLHPYAPHISAELYDQLYPGSKALPFGEDENGNPVFPKFDASLLVESSKEYPISINGKMRTTMSFSVDVAQADIEKSVLENEIVQKWLEGKEPKKIIFVKNKMVNVVAP
jgi:leucyl-tRNA synthetase